MTKELKTVYRRAVNCIAFNDGNGDYGRLHTNYVASMISVCVIADAFNIDPIKVAKAVIRLRKKHNN